MGEEEIDDARLLPPEDRAELDPATLPEADEGEDLPVDEPVDESQAGS